MIREVKHTPGPWAAFTDSGGRVPHTNIVSLTPATRVVFSLPGHEKSSPDVSLITASPILLSLLIEVRERCLFEDDFDGIGVSEDVVIDANLFDRICRAINMAEGCPVQDEGHGPYRKP